MGAQTSYLECPSGVGSSETPYDKWRCIVDKRKGFDNAKQGQWTPKVRALGRKERKARIQRPSAPLKPAQIMQGAVVQMRAEFSVVIRWWEDLEEVFVVG